MVPSGHKYTSKQAGEPHRIAALAASVGTSREMLDCSRSQIYRLLHSGHLQAVKAGRRTMILVASINAYIAALPPARFSAGSKPACPISAGTNIAG